MRISRKFIMVILLLIGLLGFLLISTYYYINDNKKTFQAKISVIVYGNNSERWATLKQGVDLGAQDFGVQVNFVTMSEEEPEEQMKLLDREIKNGAQGIILAAVDSVKMSKAVKEAIGTCPVVMIETNIEKAKEMVYISADNYSMGLNLGRSVLLNSKDKRKVALFIENQNRDSIKKRLEGILDSFQFTDYVIKIWEMSKYDNNPILYLQKMIKEDPADNIVALDDNSLEAIIDAVKSTETSINIFGIGSTNKIVHYLDYGLITSIVFQNEFNMGYLGVQEVIHALEGKGGNLNSEIEFRTINKETMYLPKNQRLVFQVVQ